mmetsp:Transcript_28050/g.97030  ORF Transcript_28050/g.97030 Transcript_28050/m.97030 type:complete len:689 (+) Transcript_28050:591-2657(+)
MLLRLGAHRLSQLGPDAGDARVLRSGRQLRGRRHLLRRSVATARARFRLWRCCCGGGRLGDAGVRCCLGATRLRVVAILHLDHDVQIPRRRRVARDAQLLHVLRLEVLDLLRRQAAPASLRRLLDDGRNDGAVGVSVILNELSLFDHHVAAVVLEQHGQHAVGRQQRDDGERAQRVRVDADRHREGQQRQHGAREPPARRRRFGHRLAAQRVGEAGLVAGADDVQREQRDGEAAAQQPRLRRMQLRLDVRQQDLQPHARRDERHEQRQVAVEEVRARPERLPQAVVVGLVGLRLEVQRLQQHDGEHAEGDEEGVIKPGHEGRQRERDDALPQRQHGQLAVALAEVLDVHGDALGLGRAVEGQRHEPLDRHTEQPHRRLPIKRNEHGHNHRQHEAEVAAHLPKRRVPCALARLVHLEHLEGADGVDEQEAPDEEVDVIGVLRRVAWDRDRHADEADAVAELERAVRRVVRVEARDVEDLLQPHHPEEQRLAHKVDKAEPGEVALQVVAHVETASDEDEVVKQLEPRRRVEVDVAAVPVNDELWPLPRRAAEVALRALDGQPRARREVAPDADDAALDVKHNRLARVAHLRRPAHRALAQRRATLRVRGLHGHAGGVAISVCVRRRRCRRSGGIGRRRPCARLDAWIGRGSLGRHDGVALQRPPRCSPAQCSLSPASGSNDQWCAPTRAP